MKLMNILIAAFFLAGCGVQSIPQSKNGVEAALAEVTNQYKRRIDLIPNLVKVVKGYASHEKETLEAVISARAKATSVNIDASNITPEQMMAFQKAQGGLSSALGKLMVVSERYPDLKANENFQQLQSQLEGTENRIAIARRRYIEAINSFNNLVTVPPTSFTNAVFYKYPKMPQFELSGEEKGKAEQAPQIDL